MDLTLSRIQVIWPPLSQESQSSDERVAKRAFLDSLSPVEGLLLEQPKVLGACGPISGSGSA